MLKWLSTFILGYFFLKKTFKRKTKIDPKPLHPVSDNTELSRHFPRDN